LSSCSPSSARRAIVGPPLRADDPGAAGRAPRIARAGRRASPRASWRLSAGSSHGADVEARSTGRECDGIKRPATLSGRGFVRPSDDSYRFATPRAGGGVPLDGKGDERAAERLADHFERMHDSDELVGFHSSARTGSARPRRGRSACAVSSPTDGRRAPRSGRDARVEAQRRHATGRPAGASDGSAAPGESPSHGRLTCDLGPSR